VLDPVHKDFTLVLLSGAIKGKDHVGKSRKGGRGIGQPLAQAKDKASLHTALPALCLLKMSAINRTKWAMLPAIWLLVFCFVTRLASRMGSGSRYPQRAPHPVIP
jgi:hypothetical protein